MTQAFDLTGRTALITGASSGLGVRFSRIMAAAGARVVLAARRVDRLEGLKAEIEAVGGQAVAVALDVADEASTIAAYDAAEAAFGPIDTVVANAGAGATAPITELSVADFDQLTSVNLRGVFLTVREGGRRMIAAGSRETRRGRVVIVASIAADVALPGLAAYAATKAGVRQMGRTIAREWVRQGINVNMICPGYVKTEINADWFDSEGGAKQVSGFPRRRLMEEGDLDAMLLYLASDASGAVTGASFTIDDGQSF